MIRPRVLAFAAALALPAAAAAAPAPSAVARISPAIVSADGYPARRTAFAGGVTGLADLTYSSPLGYRPLKLDLYLPPRASRGRAP